MISNKHEFAFYRGDDAFEQGAYITIDDTLLYHRMIQVVRLVVDDICVLFNRHHVARVQVKKIAKRSLEVLVLTCYTITPLQPAIHLIMPLLKRDAWQSALYSAGELGVNAIYPITTEKSQERHLDIFRAQKILIAAAEQSKNFALPDIHTPTSLQNALKQQPIGTSLLCCIIHGQSSWSVMEQLHHQPPHTIALIVGPEGDFTQQELQQLQESRCTMIALTPTTLRSCQAVAVGVGLLRSMLV